jgi:hypothetical protein
MIPLLVGGLVDEKKISWDTVPLNAFPKWLFIYNIYEEGRYRYIFIGLIENI